MEETEGGVKNPDAFAIFELIVGLQRIDDLCLSLSQLEFSLCQSAAEIESKG